MRRALRDHELERLVGDAPDSAVCQPAQAEACADFQMNEIDSVAQSDD